MRVITTYFGPVGPSSDNTYVQYYVLREGGPIGLKHVRGAADK